MAGGGRCSMYCSIVVREGGGGGDAKESDREIASRTTRSGRRHAAAPRRSLINKLDQDCQLCFQNEW